MAVRTKTLAHGELAAGDQGDLIYTCPDGRTAILKDLCVFNNASVAESVGLYVTDGTTASFVTFESVLGVNGAQAVDRFITMEPGDELHIATVGTHATGSITYHVSGSELDGVA